MPIKKKDFIELEYTGRLKDTGDVFDTTDEKVAKESNIYSENAEYAPVVICIGEGHILKGIDEFLEGKEFGKHTVELPAEKAFGKKNSELIRMIPTNKFSEQGIKPVPGLRLNIDGMIGVVKTVSGGRCVLDFNHPLAGRDVEYELEVKSTVTDPEKQLAALLKVLLGIRAPNISVREKKATITLPAKLPDQIASELAKKIKELTGLDAEFAIEKK